MGCWRLNLGHSRARQVPNPLYYLSNTKLLLFGEMGKTIFWIGQKRIKLEVICLKSLYVSKSLTYFHTEEMITKLFANLLLDHLP